VVGVLWGFEPFFHGNHHIRVYMHHVCLIQCISARKATHIKLGTCSGSFQCQLHFGTKMVSIGRSGCEWLPSEWKMRIFRHFLRWTPLVIYAVYIHINKALAKSTYSVFTCSAAGHLRSVCDLGEATQLSIFCCFWERWPIVFSFSVFYCCICCVFWSIPSG